MLWWRCEVFNL